MLMDGLEVMNQLMDGGRDRLAEFRTVDECQR